MLFITLKTIHVPLTYQFTREYEGYLCCIWRKSVALMRSAPESSKKTQILALQPK